MIIEEPRKMANRASLIIAIRYIHPSQTQKTRRHLGFAHADQPFHSPKTIVSLVEAK
jgi:hypothetical protein